MNELLTFFGKCVIVSPLALVAVLGIPALVRRPLGERSIGGWIFAAVSIGLLASIGVLAGMLLGGTREVVIDFGNLFVIPDQHLHFHLKFVFDRLSVPFSILTYLLCGTVGAFASRYLHREPGYGRFAACYAFFLLGMIASTLAGTIEVLFLGWELVGLSSALLVAFFHERPAPVRNGLRIWSVYRIADAAFLVAAIAMHHLTGGGDFEILMGAGPWPESVAPLTSAQATSVGLLLLVAAAGKSGLVPFSGWLPRAMEGPTPSSAIFYGALSVHLGAFLLLRVSPILSLSIGLSAAVVALGLITALCAAISARVQTDIKGALAYASLTQVGIIVAEIGVGLRYIALIHIIGHACLRTLQLLRAPTLLHDYHTLENAIGSQLQQGPTLLERLLPAEVVVRLFRFGFERGYLDSMLDEYLIDPFRRGLHWCDAMERRWTDFLSHGSSRESDRVETHTEVIEELRL
ncbi:MAG: proton-conducting transporter membrane subunit [Planctomycetaceae bacterium]